jgi:hypothetical protein
MSTELLNPYCTLVEVQRECSNDDARDIDQFNEEINWASRWLDDHCRRDFLPHDHTSTPLLVKKAWIVGNVIYLPMPVRTLTGITVDGAAIAADTFVFENSNQHSKATIVGARAWDSAAGKPGFRLPVKIELTGTFGYTPAATDPAKNPPLDIPQQIRTACRIIAAIRSGKVKREFVTPDGNRQVATARNLPPDVLKSIAPYRVPVI